VFDPTLADTEHTEEYESHQGYDITVTLWSDGEWTAYIAKTEPPHLPDHVLMDNDICYSDRPDESDLHDLIDNRLGV
tara:strand:+ start:955 stop:1185 length:231 start_codon:yes stop_codon:yes gene_type:complete